MSTQRASHARPAPAAEAQRVASADAEGRGDPEEELNPRSGQIQVNPLYSPREYHGVTIRWILCRENSPMPGKPGDIICFDRGSYKHFAVNVDDGCVVHRTRDGKFLQAEVKLQLFKDVLNDKTATGEKRKQLRVAIFNHYDGKLTVPPAEVVVERALARIGEKGYQLLHKNCEHFATWCRYGTSFSFEVQGGFGKALSFLDRLLHLFRGKDGKTPSEGNRRMMLQDIYYILSFLKARGVNRLWEMDNFSSTRYAENLRRYIREGTKE